ncbi:hypothetical protein [Acinetobacter junii]
MLEHADQSIWGEFNNTKEVRNWKHIGDGLIPSHWIKTII